MKHLVTLFAGLLLTISCFAQEIFSCRNTTLSFFSATPMEDIDAVTSKGVSAINLKTGAVYFKVAVNTFKFKKQLMEEHFNENYLESDKYPHAEFKGKIIDIIDLHKDGTYNVTVEGTLSMHGVDKVYREKATVTVQDGKPAATTKFNVRLADHHIKIPTLVVKNIAEVVEVTVKATYSPS
ncbi:YceI-like domain-containing protein [Chitinophaga sp. CF118]|uniref:YceI family protein n=1 Tax=Chitinophaga sp. CF118 TaxID=1884367 RepID=UPI0008EA023C|nr:YceI family protein [Chitinophaga sp. CF118]SFD25495.1 YceI-like domain-containing protein [Chitinophaga sp. CF118]